MLSIIVSFGAGVIVGAVVIALVFKKNPGVQAEVNTAVDSAKKKL